jgi:hypothetical protein
LRANLIRADGNALHWRKVVSQERVADFEADLVLLRYVELSATEWDMYLDKMR